MYSNWSHICVHSFNFNWNWLELIFHFVHGAHSHRATADSWHVCARAARTERTENRMEKIVIEFKHSTKFLFFLNFILFVVSRLSAFWNYWEMHFGLKSNKVFSLVRNREANHDGLFLCNLCYSFLECVNACSLCVSPVSSVQCVCALDHFSRSSVVQTMSMGQRWWRWRHRRHTFTCENVNRLRWHRRTWNIWVADCRSSTQTPNTESKERWKQDHL